MASLPWHQLWNVREIAIAFNYVYTEILRRSLGRVEELLVVLQSHLLQPDGCIRYLNTAGFALRRERVELEKGVFDPKAIRAEDTLLLANMMEKSDMLDFVG